MYKERKIIALIPARGGSVRLPGKNIKSIAGKPMIAHAINKALAMDAIDRVVVSTDDPQIAAIAAEWGAEIPFRREKRLARGDTPLVDVIRDAVERINAAEHFDYILVLQANSPLTKIKDIYNVIHRGVNEDLDVVFTAAEAEHPPQWSLRIEDGVPSFAFWEDDGRELVRTQDEDLLYRSTGAATILKMSYFIKHINTLRLYFGAPHQRTGVVITDEVSSIDVDSETDFWVAQSIFARESIG